MVKLERMTWPSPPWAAYYMARGLLPSGTRLANVAFFPVDTGVDFWRGAIICHTKPPLLRSIEWRSTRNSCAGRGPSGRNRGVDVPVAVG